MKDHPSRQRGENPATDPPAGSLRRPSLWKLAVMGLMLFLVAGVLTVFVVRRSGSIKRDRPRVWTLRELKSVELGPSDKPQVVECPGQVKVTLPAGLMESPAKLTISSIENPPDPITGCGRLAAFDISLGNLHQFANDIVVELPCDVARIRTDVLPAVAVIARHYDPANDAWVQLPCAVDRSAGVVRIQTRHLSPIAADYLGDSYREVDCYCSNDTDPGHETGHVAAKVYFSDDELRTNVAPLAWARNPASKHVKRYARWRPDAGGLQSGERKLHTNNSPPRT